MALSLLFFGLNRYSIIDSFRRDYILSYFSKFKMLVCMSFLFCWYNFFVPKPRLKIKIKQSYQTKSFRIYGRTRMQCPVLVFKLLRDGEQIPEKA